MTARVTRSGAGRPDVERNHDSDQYHRRQNGAEPARFGIVRRGHSIQDRHRWPGGAGFRGRSAILVPRVS